MPDLLSAAKNHRNISSIELIRRRQAAGLTQRDLAAKVAEKLQRVSLSQAYIVQIEHGHNPDIPTEVAKVIEELLPA